MGEIRSCCSERRNPARARMYSFCSRTSLGCGILPLLVGALFFRGPLSPDSRIPSLVDVLDPHT